MTITRHFVRLCSSDTKVAVSQTAEINSLFQKILLNFPKGIQMAFAYGSGVFKQHGHTDMSKNMLDFIFVVNSPVTWHQKNMEQNRKDYSFLKNFGARYVSRIQDKYGAGIYFNTLVPCEGRMIKYGVISTDRFLTDLMDWDSLYVSGRLHKPVKILTQPISNSDILNALHVNLQSAFHTALLTLPEYFTEEELYTTITGLSYGGDLRMGVAEDSNKIKNIVYPNFDRFRELYKDFLQNEEHIYWDKVNKKLEQYPNHVSQYHHLNLLPKTVQMNLVSMRSPAGMFLDLEEVLSSLAHNSRCGEYLTRSVVQIVRHSSWTQMLKTFFTAGTLKSVKYTLNKAKKMLRSRFNS